MTEPSHFDPAIAYIAVDRHRLDDIAPYAWKTADAGKSWVSITAGLPAGANPVGVELEGDELESRLFEHPRNILAHPAETADDHVFAPGDRQRRLSLAHRRADRRPGLSEQGTRDAPILAYEDGRRDHAQNRGGQQGLHQGRIEQLAPQKQSQQRKAEFSALTDDHAGAQ